MEDSILENLIEKEQDISNLLESMEDSFNVKSTKIFLTIDGKRYKIRPTDDILNHIEEKIEKNIKSNINMELKKIKEKVLKNLTDAINMYKHGQSILVKRIKEYDSIIKSDLPRINFSHFEKGVFVCKNDENNNFIYLVRGVYNPRFLIYSNGNKIETFEIKKDLADSMATPIFFKIEVDLIYNKVISLCTLRYNDLEIFNHYHQQNPDCWGTWDINRIKCNTHEDAITIARKAEDILQTINRNSIAKEKPLFLPDISKIEYEHNLRKIDTKIRYFIKPDTPLFKRMGYIHKEEYSGWNTSSTHQQNYNIYNVAYYNVSYSSNTVST